MAVRVSSSLAFGALLLATGSAIGWWVRDAGSARARVESSKTPAPSETRRQAEPTGHVAIHAVDTSGIKDAVREAVNEELARARAEASAAAAADSAATEPTPEVYETIESGHHYIEQAIQTGRWGPEQAAHLRSLGANLTGEQLHGLVQPLSVAINAGRLQVEGEGPLF